VRDDLQEFEERVRAITDHAGEALQSLALTDFNATQWITATADTFPEADRVALMPLIQQVVGDFYAEMNASVSTYRAEQDARRRARNRRKRHAKRR